MRDVAQMIAELQYEILEVARLEQQREDMLKSAMSAAKKDELAQRIADRIAESRRGVEGLLEDFAAFPPRHARHAPFLEAFAKNGSFDRSVFIMTKFADPTKPAVTDPQLQAVIDAVRAAVTKAQHVPRVASDQDYHARLWDNVELHLLGCRQGIAIVEDKVLPELNPNVAIEWGWMVGMGRRVLYLRETGFQRQRADWNGLIESTFDWADPVPGIDAAVQKFLAR